MKLRRAFAVALTSVGLVSGMTPIDRAGSAGAADGDPCVDGFSVVAPTSIVVPEAVYAASPSRAFAAGGVPLSGGRRAARIARYDTAGWHSASTMRLGNDAGYVAIGGTRATGLWAVGYVQTRTSLAPLTTRQRRDGSWRRVRTPQPPKGGATLTDVAVRKRASAWAVGYRLGKPGQRWPYALRWAGGRWRVRNPSLRSGERGMLTGVSSTIAGGTWVVGSATRNGRTRPYLARRQGGWQRMKLPPIGDGALAAISVPSTTNGWAVGYQVAADGTMDPLLLHWDGGSWRRDPAPPQFDGDTVVFDVSEDDSGVLTLVGSTWIAGARRMSGFVASRREAGWTIDVYAASPLHSVLTAVDGDPSTSGWAVGRELKAGVALQTCSTAAPASAKRTQRLRRARRAASRTARQAVAGGSVHPTELTPQPRSGLPRVPRLQVAAAGNVKIRDRARAAGLPTTAVTHGAVVKDFDGNGQPDIFLGGHTTPARLFLSHGATFKQAAVNFGRGDRHGCAAADVDGSGLPDLYCSFGGGRGLGVKGNQLWLDPGGSDPRLEPNAGGAPEPLGRGRLVAFMDVNNDGRSDLVVGQQQNRVDALPSNNRVYLRNGAASFRALSRSGLGTGIGVTSLDSGDVDRDGRSDLVLTYSDPQAAGATSGIKLYRNTPHGFRQVQARYGVKSIGERDAELVRLNKDRRLDLIQLSSNRIRISLQRHGTFHTVFERRVANAVAVAVGDADGDGDNDIYVLRQKKRASVKDIILFNRGGGRSYRAVAAPSRAGGKADDVVPIDYDGNGLTDFLVLNGGGAGKGSVQLISFFR